MQPQGASRRVVIAGTCAAALGGCSTYGGSSGGPAPPPSPTAALPAASGAAAAPPPPLAKVADIPVGGGKVFSDQQVVLTQPEAGTIKAFSATCTHAGCAVTAVSGGTINCPCHGSRFEIADGSVADGPASRPLPPVAVTVDGDAITLAELASTVLPAPPARRRGQ